MALNSRIKTGLSVLGVGAVVLLLLLVGLVAFPALVGGNATYIVTSDSMSPAIEAGDVVVTRDVPADEIEEGDVVTFHDGNPERGSITHRVIEVREEGGERYFKTKGDANEDPDAGYVPAEYAQGTVHLHLPYLGYLLLFARSPAGLFTLVILPGIFLVGSGCWQLLREYGYAPSGDRLLESVLDPEVDGAGEGSLESESGGSVDNEPLESADDPAESEVER